MTGQRLRILLVEDSADDAELMLCRFREAGVRIEHGVCADEAGLRDALRRDWDIVVTDHSLPGFSSSEVIALVRADPRDIPVIVVSGAVSDEEAVALMKLGAADFVPKHKLHRLLPATMREIREARFRHGERQALIALRESRRQLRKLSMFLQEVREREQTRIARELHDELGQMLSGLRMDLDGLRRRLPDPDPAVAAKLQGMDELIDHGMSTIRRICSELRPAVLDDLGLVAAVEWLVDGFRRRSGLLCELQVGLQDLAPGEPHATTLFRILQESLTNVGRHAKASRVRICLGAALDHLWLEVADDGVGFDPERAASVSFGLLGIRERVFALGGRFRIDSRPGAGTRIRAELPY